MKRPFRRCGADKAGASKVDHFAPRLETVDADDIRAHLDRLTVEMGEVVTRHGAEGDGPAAHVTDPDGITVELEGPPSG